MDGTTSKWHLVKNFLEPSNCEGLDFKEIKIQIYFWLNKICSVEFLIKVKGTEQSPPKQMENGAQAG